MRRLPIMALATLVIGLASAYWLAYPSYSHRYRLTIEVETPAGLKSASSVIQSEVETQPTITDHTGAVTSLRGDAVLLDLGGGKNAIALLATGTEAKNQQAMVYLAPEAFHLARCGTPFCSWKLMEGVTGARDLPLPLTPTLMTLSDANDPKTALIIQPSEFPVVFGPGYNFKRAWIEMTDAPVTRSIKQRLPWLTGFKGVTGGNLVYDRTKNPGQYLTADHFSR